MKLKKELTLLDVFGHRSSVELGDYFSFFEVQLRFLERGLSLRQLSFGDGELNLERGNGVFDGLLPRLRLEEGAFRDFHGSIGCDVR